MTQSEKLSIIHGLLGAPWGGRPKPAGALGSAGYVPGVPRLGVPALQETDAELGVANGRPATAMPSNLALASTWDLGLARRQGAAVGAEARVEGFNVLLGGAANLIRDPRGGRNFEYFSEDPLVTGLMAGAAIDGAQSRQVIATAKHFALNNQETDRVVLDVRIDPGAARESDLFAFEIAIERGGPGAVMCAYNQVNGVYSCENDWLLNQVLKGDWRYPGFVMSDWGAVHSTVRSALAGLDQELGEQLDTQNFFERLGSAVADGDVPQTRLDGMAQRILTSIFACGLADGQVASDPPDLAFSDATALAVEQEGAVLLRNEGLLPLPQETGAILVVGAHADRGAPAGGGSSQVAPRGGIAFKEPEGRNRAMIFDPSSPLDAIRKEFPRARVDYDDGRNSARAAKAAEAADAVIVFADQYMTETIDAPNLSLPKGQDELIERLARANPRIAVVLETGGPVLMPWLDRTGAVIEAWYPGQKGGEAIASVLSGAVNPSGRLPVTFPKKRSAAAAPENRGRSEGRADRAGRSWRALSKDVRRRLPRRRVGRLQMVLRAGRTAAVSIRLRPILYDVRSQQPRREPRRRRRVGERDRQKFGRQGRGRHSAVLSGGAAKRFAAACRLEPDRPRPRRGAEGDDRRRSASLRHVRRGRAPLADRRRRLPNYGRRRRGPPRSRGEHFARGGGAAALSAYRPTWRRSPHKSAKARLRLRATRR